MAAPVLSSPSWPVETALWTRPAEATRRDESGLATRPVPSGARRGALLRRAATDVVVVVVAEGRWYEPERGEAERLERGDERSDGDAEEGSCVVVGAAESKTGQLGG
jgi:hypothetical protein